MNASKNIQEYFKEIENKLKEAYNIAENARKKGFDPEDRVDIPLARGISQRVEGLISAVAPQIIKSGISQRIDKLEKEFGSLNWMVAFKISEEVAKQKFCSFNDEREAIEIGIRVGLAYITLGVIAAPLEGFIELKIKDNAQGKKYLSTFFAGPIRAAGGTAAALTLLIADYIRVKMGYEKYEPTELEVKRYIIEIQDYHERITNLQYMPSEEEIEYLATHIPVEINGDPTERIEVSNYKDLPRVETNRIRGGMCLVLAEGIAQKAPKIFKQAEKWSSSNGFDWRWLGKFLELQKKIKSKGEIKDEGSDNGKISPNYIYIKDLVAGRPVLSHPLKVGGFRLRYGRTRTSGFAATSIHPATMLLLNKYIATGTQLKVERPGKATVVSPCNFIEGPIVRLTNGSVYRIESENEMKEHIKEIDKILFLGDMLVNYGDFSENGHPLVPAGYCEEWWAQELEKEVVNMFGTLDFEKLSEIVDITAENFERIIKDPIKTKITFRAARNISEKLKVSLHPLYTYYWNNITKENLQTLIDSKKEFKIKEEEGSISKIIIPFDENIKNIFENIGIPHILAQKEFIVLEKHHAQSLYSSIGEEKEIDNAKIKESISTVDAINKISPIEIKDKQGTFIGSRMGRPEKAKQRKLTGSPHVLFPVGSQGGRLRSFQAALEEKKIVGDFPTYKCNECNKQTINSICETCGKKTQKTYYCSICGITEKPCNKKTDGKKHFSMSYKNQSLDIVNYFKQTLKNAGLKNYPDLIKGVRGTSNKDHEPEHLLKGILRAKHKIHVNKDGTTRYDMIEMPITHFKAKEIGTTIARLIELGYKKDVYGKNLENEEQIIEIMPQDIILPDSPDSPDEYASSVLIRVCHFVDELLERLYNEKAYYHVKTRDDLIGRLVVGLAPHTSAGMVGRIIGFSKTQGMYCHPMFHAAMRRNCDGDEACVMMLFDALLNFSRNYLPDKRGSRTMDAPLVLTSVMIPSEIDDEVHGMDIVWKYPLEMYEAALEFKNPWDVKVKQIKDVLGKEEQYEGMGFTHNCDDMNGGIRCSAYKTLPSMKEKLAGQMELAEKIGAVDEIDVARLVIEKHFMKDIKGNLRKFSLQEVRCVKCNEKFRRHPLIGSCTKCGGRIIFTVSEGSVVKYLEPAISLARKYNVSPYLKQSLELVKRRVEDVFGKEPEIQAGLGSWFD